MKKVYTLRGREGEREREGANVQPNSIKRCIKSLQGNEAFLVCAIRPPLPSELCSFLGSLWQPGYKYSVVGWGEAQLYGVSCRARSPGTVLSINATFSQAPTPLEVGSLCAQQIPTCFPPFPRLPCNRWGHVTSQPMMSE